MRGHIRKLPRYGFTIVELLIVIVVIGLLATFVMLTVNGVRTRAFEAKTQSEVRAMKTGILAYEAKYGYFPCDVSRNVPPGLEEFLSQSDIDRWPDAPWPGSVYDYDVFDASSTDGVSLPCRKQDGSIDTVNTYDTVQISVRFCTVANVCNFPNDSWAANFDQNSSWYICIKGYCRSHPNQPVTHPGYCFNCPNHAAIPTP